MSCLDAKISLVPKHKLIVPSPFLAPATQIQTDKATKPQWYIRLDHWHWAIFQNSKKTNVYPTIQIYYKIQYSLYMISNMVFAANTVLVTCNTLLLERFWPAHSIHILFFLTVRHIYCSETAHLPLEIIILNA